MLNTYQPEKKKESVVNFEENFDVLFNNRRLEIQQEILQKKEKKEQSAMQNTKQATTTAYEPIQQLDTMMK